MQPRPRVVLDATAISERPTGAGRFALNLARALPSADPATDYVALVTRAGSAALADVAQLERVTVAPTRGLAWELTGASAAARKAGGDLLFTTREVVWSVHPPTMIHVFEPPVYRLRARTWSVREAKPHAKDALLAAAFGRSLRRAAAVTAGSETTAGWLREHCGIDSGIILPAIDDEFFAYDGPGREEHVPYFLHLATGDLRECTDLVLEALALLEGESPRLLIAGARGERGGALTRRAQELGLEGRVELLGWVTDDELRACYRGAVALLHPTRYEGYGGYPALEAMTLGTPVVGLRAPGATEALQGAAVLLDSEDPVALAEQLRLLLRDRGTRREELAAAGRQRVAMLRWDRTAAAFAQRFAEARAGVKR